MRINNSAIYIFAAIFCMIVISCDNKKADKIDDSDIVAVIPFCGDAVVDEGELCDSTQAECSKINPEIYEDGIAVCKDDCQGYDMSSCILKTQCGNYIVEMGEACDGNPKRCNEIDSEKYVMGTAPCFKTCSGWDSKVCKTYHECGNGNLEEREICERGHISDCTALNSEIFISGTAECYNDCSGWNVSKCRSSQCENIECGIISVVENDYVFEFECGKCDEGDICTFENKCIVPCGSGKCGTIVIKDSIGEDMSFKCRDCNDLQYCNAENQCIPACSNMACGDDHGVNCGECPSGFYCSTFPNRCKKLPDVPVVEIPDGVFYMGCNHYVDDYCNEAEDPYHMVYLSPYLINTQEVTVKEYLYCIDSGQCSDKVEDGSHYRTYDINNRCNIGSERELDQPANCVNYYGAEAFCKFMGGRLPTEAQWEKAARGGCEFYENCEEDTPMFPWGNDQASCQYAVIVDVNSGIAGCETGGTFPVGSKPDGISPYGLYDMAGNVWEWCSDWFGSDYYTNSPSEDPIGPETGIEKILKGGSCNFSWVGVRSSYRYNVAPSLNYTFGGFRCVFDSEN
ncbi:MAG TPA: SUMF1/EgtB/PvdO family nonheme iron enzyme [bacterium]|nr:SUMF1/EgtB/PvdO family nonheme iron enzyme [bacterium]